MIEKDRNDLQKIVEKKYIKISKLIKLINNQEGCILSRMTGSGSACYESFNQKTAKFAMSELKRKNPKYWCVITKLFNLNFYDISSNELGHSQAVRQWFLVPPS